MSNFLEKPQNPSLIGFLQVIGVSLYSALVAGFFFLMDKISTNEMNYLGIVLLLILMVFSAALTGAMVFGYPAYLALKNKIKEALQILAYTLVYGIIIILLVIFVLIFLEIN